MPKFMPIPMQPFFDAQLETQLVAAQKGDARAFEAIVDQFQSQVFDLATWVTGNPNDGEDITQDVFLRFLKHLPGLNAQKNLRGWFYRVTLNLSRNHLRKNRRQTQLSQLQTDQLSAPIDHNREDRDWIFDHLTSLTFKERSALILVHILGCSTQESGQILRCRSGTVKALCFRARKKLQQIRQREQR